MISQINTVTQRARVLSILVDRSSSMSQLVETIVTVLLLAIAWTASTAAGDSCIKYREFQDAWAQLRDPVAAGLSLEDQQRLTSLYDPRRLNTQDIRNCTGNEMPSDDQQNIVIQSWPSAGTVVPSCAIQRPGNHRAQITTIRMPCVDRCTFTRHSVLAPSPHSARPQTTQLSTPSPARALPGVATARWVTPMAKT